MQKTASVFSVISFVTGLIMPVLFLIFFLSGMFNTEDYVSLIVFTVLASCLWTVPAWCWVCSRKSTARRLKN